MKPLLIKPILAAVVTVAACSHVVPAQAADYTVRQYTDYQSGNYGNPYNQGYAPAYAGPSPAYSTPAAIYSGAPRRYYRDQSGTEQVGKGAVGLGDRSAKVGVGVGAKAAKEAFKAVF